jgi:cysteine desulfurase
VDKYGIVHPEEVKKALRKETILVSVMHANNEVGTVEPIEEIAQVVKENSDAYFHTDAVQSVGYLDIDVKKMGIDLLSLSGHKFYGPKGVGAIYIREGVRIFPFMHGGAQENNRRAGTHNVPGIVGLGKACELITQEKVKTRKEVKSLRDFFIKKVEEEFPHAELAGHLERRRPNNANFIFPGVEGESLVLALDLEGVCISSGSACSSGATKPSHVLLALGYSPDKARCCARFTLGKDSTREDLEYTMEALKKALRKLEKISPLL